MTQDSITILRRLGERRARLQEQQDALAEEIRSALVASEGTVSRVDAANLLGIDRTTLYRVYLKDN